MPFNLSQLDGVTFSAGALTQETGLSNVNYSENQATVTSGTQSYGPNSYHGSQGENFAIAPQYGEGGFSVGANAFTGVSYSGEPSATSTSGAIFGTINLQNATGSYAYYVVGFGYHSLLVTSEWNNGSSFEKFQAETTAP